MMIGKRENKALVLTEGPVVSTLLRFTVPFLLAKMLQTFYGTVDTLVIGNFGASSGVSAVSSGAGILAIVANFAIGLSSGGTVLVGQSIGAKNEKWGAKIVGNIIIVFSALSLVLLVASLLAYPVAIELLNVPPEAVEEAGNYLRICSLGIPLIIGYNIVCALIRAMGDSKSPLIFVGLACVINIIGDLVLTGVLGMGASGVAISTVVAQGFSFFYSLRFLMKLGMSFAFGRKDSRFDSKCAASIFKVGGPMGLQSILINLSFMFITAIINSMGVAASAAMGIGDKIVGIAFMPQGAFSASVSVMVSQNYGAKKMDRVEKTVKTAILTSVSFGVLVCFVSQLFPELMPSLFTKDKEVIVLAGQYMRAFSIDAILTSVTFCMSGMMNGCGKTTFNMTQNIISTFLGRVPATYLFSRLANTNLFIIGCAAPASTLLSLIMLGIYIKSGKWKCVGRIEGKV